MTGQKVDSLPENAAEDENLWQPDTPLSLTGQRILLAEDNELNQEIARTLLEMQGAVVDVADNGQESCRTISKTETRRLSGDFDGYPHAGYGRH